MTIIVRKAIEEGDYEFNDDYSIDATFEVDEEATADTVANAVAKAMMLEGFAPTSIVRGFIEWALNNDINVEEIIKKME